MKNIIKANIINQANINAIANAIIKIPNDKLAIISTSITIIGIGIFAISNCDIAVQYKDLKINFCPAKA